MERSLMFKSFVEKWTHPEYRPTPVPLKSICDCAEKLKVIFPNAYIEYITKYGSGGPTIELLDSIIHENLEIRDVANVYTPDEIGWSMESLSACDIYSDIVPFAADSMGNLFCFGIEEISELKDDAAVWYYDHDFDTFNKINDSFTDWIYAFVQINKQDA